MSKIFGATFSNQTFTPYEKVMTQTNKNQIPLEHSHSGDVVLIGAPGYVMGSDIEKNVSSTH